MRLPTQRLRPTLRRLPAGLNGWLRPMRRLCTRPHRRLPTMRRLPTVWWLPALLYRRLAALRRLPAGPQRRLPGGRLAAGKWLRGVRWLCARMCRRLPTVR
ncbi:hypothetical protein CF165_02740 [Amycolatopsis vastitatis]|uniref:Uncharacterized protein n=1 Tax=Amycolatopsis vastitatis TaxID=1905142 RepID=A0A229TIW7_9PSEU|nr:hypothetical protein CF165_02740 [Amycolatopsis vastitatis]